MPPLLDCRTIPTDLAFAFHFVLEELSPFHQGEERVAEREVQRRNRLRPNQICIGKLLGDLVSVDRRGECGAAAGEAVLSEPHASIELHETIAERRGLDYRELALCQELMVEQKGVLL